MPAGECADLGSAGCLAAEVGDNADGCAGGMERRQVRPHEAAGAFVNEKSRVKMSEQRLDFLIY
jgi:hypothetical protein